MLFYFEIGTKDIEPITYIVDSLHHGGHLGGSNACTVQLKQGINISLLSQ